MKWMCLFCFLVLACNEPNGNNDDDLLKATPEQNVTIKYWVDYDKFSIIDEDGTAWYPVNLPSEFQIDGLKCAVCFSITYPQSEGCLVCGVSVYLTSIKELP